MLPTIAAFLSLCASLAILHQAHAQLSAARFGIICAAASIASIVFLINIDAEPWAYLLCCAGVSLYSTIATFHRKYHKISPNSKGSQDRNNRRARRRER